MNDKFNTLKNYARRLTSKPGVYCMINRKEESKFENSILQLMGRFKKSKKPH